MNTTPQRDASPFFDGRHSRTENLIGKKAVEKLCKSRVAVFGLGGVGSYVVEALARAGVGNFILIDKDRVSESNINRQIIATYDTIGELKTDISKARILSINPDSSVITYALLYGKDTVSCVDFSTSDYVVDAIDTVTAKLLIAEICRENKIPLISSMGTGNKTDPAQLELTDISKTQVCPLARVMRRELKKRGIEHLPVVYSKEIPHKIANSDLGERIPASISFVPATAGLLIASQVIKELTQDLY